jgi:hypothetical protein
VKHMLRVLPLLVFSAALRAAEPAPAGTPVPAAATPPGAGDTRAVQAGSTDGEGSASADEADATRKANERFKPSEKISEDLSVSFPADI